MDPILIASAIAVVMVFVVLFMGKGSSQEVKAKIIEELNEVRKLADGDASARRDCVVKLDTLFGKGLKVARIKGETVGERLKNARDLYDRKTYDNIWKVHKLRNAVVHEQHEVTISEVREALQVFNSAIRRLVS